MAEELAHPDKGTGSVKNLKRLKNEEGQGKGKEERDPFP